MRVRQRICDRFFLPQGSAKINVESTRKLAANRARFADSTHRRADGGSAAKKFVREFVSARPNLTLTPDAAGNLRVDYAPVQKEGKKRAPLVMVAHLDHPGFHVSKIDGATVELNFQGSVSGRHAVPGSRVEFFARGNPHPIGDGELIERAESEGPLKSAKARINNGEARADGFAMWAFPGFSLENCAIVTRCCDDLLGAAAALCVLDEISNWRRRTWR